MIPSVFIFLFGLVIGSFLNAVIWRIDSRRPIWRGRSVCPTCLHELSWQDLIPVLSFLLLCGRCRYCAAAISWQYPFVELACGVLFVATSFPQSSLPGLALLWYLVASLIVIFVYDLKHSIIPDEVVYPAIVVSLGASLMSPDALISGILASGFFFAIHALSRGQWMGLGDVKLALLMGLMLGFPGILVALFFSFVAGAAFSLPLVLARKKQWKSEVPFGPFLVAGTFVALFWGENIANWYLGLILS
ncbi:MAG: prepilin peptidase [bacterium]|nr:prepilin peptidase [bacterium]